MKDIQKLKGFSLWLYNLKLTDPRKKLIRCKECGLVQIGGYCWDYQRCDKCDNYLYDTRDLF